jgi:transposase-like protein
MIDILRILKDYSISHDTNVNPGWVNVNCPFCHPKDTGHHGGFKLDGEYYNCWKCGGHRLDSTLMRLLRLDYSAYQEFIGQYSTEMMICM